MRTIRLAIVLLLAGLQSAAAQELRMGVQSAFVIDPHILFLGPNMAAARHLYDSFVGKDADAHWVPTLAESWNQVDSMTWEFKLRRGVPFVEPAHDHQHRRCRSVHCSCHD